VKKRASAAPPRPWPKRTRTGTADGPSAAPGSRRRPISPATTITSTWPHAPGHAVTTTAATTAIVARSRSGQSARAIPHTACATTATAAILSPRSQPALERSRPRIDRAKSTRRIADGSVKPSHAASPPARPARKMPTAMPTWLLAGPGRNWQRATTSA